MKKTLIFYGGWEGHTPYETALVFENILKRENYDVILTDNMDIFNSFDNIADIDLFVPVYTMGNMTAEQEKNIAKAVSEGAGMAGCHGGMCDSFRNNTTWQFMTGAQWVAHPGNSNVKYKVNLMPDNEFTEGLNDFEYFGEQYYLHVDPAVKVFATTGFPVVDGEHTPNGCVQMPVIFTKKWGKGNIFYFSIGHTYKDFEIPEVKIIMKRGFLWATR